MSSKLERTPAYLLKTIDYRDADRIVTLLTRDLGRMSAIARGARRSLRRFGGRLETFAEIEVEVRPGRGDLGTLASATVLHAHLGLVSDLCRMRCAGACLEFVRVVAPEREPEPRLFDTVRQVLATIETASSQHAADRALSFCARALAIVGWAPDLETCGVTGRRCPPDRSAFFDPRRGTLVTRHAGGGPLLLSAEARRALGRSFGDGWQKVVWSRQARREASNALGALVNEHLGRELSRAWYSALAALTQ